MVCMVCRDECFWEYTCRGTSDCPCHTRHTSHFTHTHREREKQYQHLASHRFVRWSHVSFSFILLSQVRDVLLPLASLVGWPAILHPLPLEDIDSSSGKPRSLSTVPLPCQCGLPLHCATGIAPIPHGTPGMDRHTVSSTPGAYPGAVL